MVIHKIVTGFQLFLPRQLLHCESCLPWNEVREEVTVLHALSTSSVRAPLATPIGWIGILLQRMSAQNQPLLVTIAGIFQNTCSCPPKGAARTLNSARLLIIPIWIRYFHNTSWSLPHDCHKLPLPNPILCNINSWDLYLVPPHVIQWFPINVCLPQLHKSTRL